MQICICSMAHSKLARAGQKRSVDGLDDWCDVCDKEFMSTSTFKRHTQQSLSHAMKLGNRGRVAVNAFKQGGVQEVLPAHCTLHAYLVDGEMFA